MTILVLKDKFQLMDLLVCSVAAYNQGLDNKLVGLGTQLKHRLETKDGERTVLAFYVNETLLRERIGGQNVDRAIARLGNDRRPSRSYQGAFKWKVDITDV